MKVIDFGLAKAVADAGTEMDLTHGEFVGTPNFASPEQFGSDSIDVALRHLLVRRHALVCAHRKNAIYR